MLKTKSFLLPREDSDGLRISVVGKHKWEPGIMTYTDLTEIAPSMYDEWLKVLAPPVKLVGDLYIRKTCSNEEFRERYLKYVRQPDVRLEVEGLAERALDLDITLLCLEESPEFCHRKYLAEECRRYQQGLVLKIE